MANIKITGQAIVVTSSMRLEDIKTIKKYRPGALVLKGGEDGKEPIFALGVGEGRINSIGASFNQATRDDAKLATLTMTTTYDGDDIQGFVSDTLGAAIINLNKLEETLPAVLEEIEAEKACIAANISVVQ